MKMICFNPMIAIITSRCYYLIRYIHLIPFFIPPSNNWGCKLDFSVINKTSIENGTLLVRTVFWLGRCRFCWRSLINGAIGVKLSTDFLLGWLLLRLLLWLRVAGMRSDCFVFFPGILADWNRLRRINKSQTLSNNATNEWENNWAVMGITTTQQVAIEFICLSPKRRRRDEFSRPIIFDPSHIQIQIVKVDIYLQKEFILVSFTRFLIFYNISIGSFCIRKRLGIWFYTHHRESVHSSNERLISFSL